MKSEQEVLEQIGIKLKEIRISKGYSSYEDFALEHGIARMQYWRLEAGKSNPTIKTLYRVLEIHQVSLQEFFSEGF
ncbi:helix-turn-helix transcriptional regulator [Pontibacter burrus]|uniref:Helix-turn-helix transcriptional regulator n=1 Tax=Pontibacter burrus TaxID=2704466 RepID=A0A6B3M0U2_9BACT|nr:helix-turn-helix transcriptional regulator [Pontibacter burrus]NEM99458.1 helix-turn-helix transcriptional regulator [Pontibacter burrus]